VRVARARALSPAKEMAVRRLGLNTHTQGTRKQSAAVPEKDKLSLFEPGPVMLIHPPTDATAVFVANGRMTI